MSGPDVITRTVWYENGRFRTSRHTARHVADLLLHHEQIHEEHFHNKGFYPPVGVYQVIYQRSERGDCEVYSYKHVRFPGIWGGVPVCFIGEWPVGTRFFRYVVTA